MPTVGRVGPFRFFFYSNEQGEPPHVHAEGARGVAEFWLEPVSLAFSRGLRAHELRRLEVVVEEHRFAFLEAWYGHFGP